MNRITDTIMPHKTIIRLSGVARNPANGFPARLLAYSPALAAVDVDINYLEKQYQSGVRTELRDVERVDAQDGPMFLARLWTLAEFAVHSDHVSGMVEVDFP